jgi:Complex1_LYR-like
MSDLRAVIKLYRQLRCLHRSKLPPPMREVGDRYVKAEFQAHLQGKTTAEQWRLFGVEWTRYQSALRGDLTADAPSVDVLCMKLSPEQARRVGKLYKEAKAVRKQLIQDVLPD